MSAFAELLQEWKELTPEQRTLLEAHFTAVMDENTRQNLTRITDPIAFFEENLGDARVLAAIPSLTGPIYDLGSGAGLPGIPLAIIRPDLEFILGDAEKQKAAFLSAVQEKLSLGNVRVSSERGEVFLQKNSAPTVITRAVGPISRIWAWIGECSTWNELFLFKGPGWDEEWNAFESKKARQRLELVRVYDYEVGRETRKTRRLIHLKKMR